MATNSITGMVSIHRLRTGATVQLYLSVDKGLYQLVNSDGSCVPNWAETANQPTITPQVMGATMSDPHWYKDMPAGTAESQRSQYEVTSGSGYSITNGALRFLKSPVDKTDIHNITYTFICKVTTGGTTETIQRSITVVCRQGGENSYWGHINADGGTTLGAIIVGGTTQDRNSTTLKPSLWLGSTDLDESGTPYTVEWYKTAGGAGGADLRITSSMTTEANGLQLDGKNLIVSRKGVDGMAHFECHFLVNGNEVEAEGIQIADNADEYFVSIAGDKNVYTGSGTQVQLVATVYTRVDNKVKQCTNWRAVVTDSERMHEYNAADYTIQNGAGTTAGSGVFSMLESKMYVPNTTAGGAYKDEAKKWLSCGDSAAQDTAVASPADATECDVNVQFIATF